MNQPNNFNLYNEMKLVNTTQFELLPVPSQFTWRKNCTRVYWSSRRWSRNPCTFYKIVRDKSLGYLYQFNLPNDPAYLTQTVITSNRFFVD